MGIQRITRARIDKSVGKNEALFQKPFAPDQADHPLVRLQRILGNHAIGRIVQARLEESTKNDEHEGETEDPSVIQAQLGNGQPLETSVSSRFGSALRRNFSPVRVHTDSHASQLSHRLNARAFTVGEHIAFGAGEYRPGTLIGDAVIAHELAHVAQQSGSNSSQASQVHEVGDSALFEAEANRTAAESVWSLHDRSNSSASLSTQNTKPGLKSGLRLQRCGATSRQIQPQRPTACTPIAPEQWRSSVEAAQNMANEMQKRDAMAALVQQAVCSLNIQVHTAGNSHHDAVHPDDYQAAPILNFDIRLNRKRSWSAAGQGRALTNNYGYFFSHGSTGYAIVGPRALDERDAAFTRMYAQHELFHTERHVRATASFEDQELETWTRDFRNYFHLLYRHRQQWSPLIQYYEGATAEARQRAFGQLVDYYNNPPVPESERQTVRDAFARWLRRRLSDREHGSKQLIQDLERELHVGTAPASESG